MRKLRAKRVEQAKALEKSAAEMSQLREAEGTLREEVAQLQAIVLQREEQIQTLQQSGTTVAALEVKHCDLFAASSVFAGAHAEHHGKETDLLTWALSS